MKKAMLVLLVISLGGCDSSKDFTGGSNDFMGGKYRLSHQIPASTTDPDERLMLDDIANQLTPTNERQFWASQNFKDNILRGSGEAYLLPWEGEFMEALGKVDEILRVLDELQLKNLGPPVYWLATGKIYYNMNGMFRVGVVFKRESPELSIVKNRVMSNIPTLMKFTKFEPIVELGFDDAKLLAQIRGLPMSFDYLTIGDMGSVRVKEVKAANDLCSRATGLSKGFAEFAAGRMRVSVSSVSLLRSSDDGLGTCSITIDTAKGPQSCMGASLYTNGREYWVGGICY